jgi:hypothetical protein
MHDDVTNTDTSGMRGADASSVRQCASGTVRKRRRMHAQYMEVEEEACADASSVRQCASGTMRMRRRMHVQYMEVEEDACAEMKEEAGTNAPPAQ